MKKKIAIIGGGIAGLTFARCLSARDYEIHIYEKKQDLGEVGAAISVFPNALSVLDEVGLLQAILKTSGRFENMFLKTDKGAVLIRSAPKSDYPVLCMHRADLLNILLAGINAQLHTDKGIKQVSNLDHGQVAVVFENGDTGVFDAVIGADGIHSTVRKYIINDGPPIFRGYNVWRGVVKADFDISYASETYGKGQRVGIVPIKDGVYGWWATCNEAFMENDEPEGTQNKLMRLFGNWHHPIPELIINTEKILKNSLADRVPRKGWSKENIVLVGDAAHPTTPNLGQGGCIAIEGAYLLAQCINKYGLSSRAYSLYEKHQFPRAKQIVNESLRLGILGQTSNPIVIGVRNFFVKITPSWLAMKIFNKHFSYRVTALKL